MNIFEYQAKKLLESNAVLIPAGEVATTAQQAEEVCDQIKGDKWMVKAQIRSGGRGEGHFANDKSLSGVQTADSPGEVRRIAEKMIDNVLHTDQTGVRGVTVKSVYIERLVEFEKQLSLSLVVDSRIKSIVLLISKYAGGNIEAIAAENPDYVISVPVDLDEGIDKQQLQQAFNSLDLEADYFQALEELIDKLVKLFIEKDASLIEINPLVIADGKFMALDAKIAFDNNALFRHQDIQELGQGHSYERSEDGLMASRDGFNYTELDGDIGILSVGAGLSLATIDAVKHYSGEPANFLDLPPDSRVARVQSALELLLSRPNIKSILINVFGGGIMRCDAIADAIMLIKKEQALNRIPITVRLTGTNANLAIRRLKEVVPEIKIISELPEAAKTAVESTAAEIAPVSQDDGDLWSKIKSVFVKN